MPKQTFWNLPAEKRQALTAIALEEFAQHDYASASVSRIVVRAGIAKGSIYQYFEDKQDLFLYLLDEAQRTLLAAVQQVSQPARTAGFFPTLRWQMSATVHAALAHPLQAQLVRRAYAMPLPFHDQLQRRAQALRRQYLRQLVEEGIARGDIKAGISPEVATLVIDAVVAELGPFISATLGLDAEEAATVDVARFGAPEVERVFDEVMAILRLGLESEPTGAAGRERSTGAP